jgi:hypothetical protein
MIMGEEEIRKLVAAGGDEGVAAFIQMAEKFLDRDGQQGLANWVMSAFQTLPIADQLALVCTTVQAFLMSKKAALKN